METLKNLTLVQWIGIMVGLNSLLMGATPQLTVLFGVNAVPYIIAIATLGNGALGVFVTVIGGQSSQVRNVLAMDGVDKIDVNGRANATLARLAIDPDQNKIAPTPAAIDKVTATAKAAIVLIAAFLLSMFLIGGTAQAATRSAPKPVFCDPLNALPGCKPTKAAAASTASASSSTTAAQPSIADAIQNLINQLQTTENGIVSNVVAALQEADADAGTIIVPANGSAPATFKDPISHACYPAEIQYLQSLPIAQKITAKPPYDVIVLFQYKRDFQNMLLSGQLIPAYLKIGCSAMIGQEAEIFAATLALVGVGATTIAPITAFAGSIGAAAISLPAIAAIIPK